MPVHSLAVQTEAVADEAVDLGGDAIDRAIRLGSAAVGHPLAFTHAGAMLDASQQFAAIAAGGGIDESEVVIGLDGEALGTLRAVRLSGVALDWDARRALADAAALIAGDLTTRARIRQADHVTGLPNRRRFEIDFPRTARGAAAGDQLILVTLADARHYNEILRALGHLCAETFVRRGVDMLRKAVGRAKLYHVSVLSFAFAADAASAERLAREIVSTFGAPVLCDGLPIATRIGVGLTSIDRDQPNPAETLRSALAAAQDSRRIGAGFSHYDRRTDEAHQRAFNLLVDLEAALKHDDQLSLVYQPRIDLGTGATAGAEVLIRWTHPTLGPISPVEFIPLAETTTIIDDVTRYVLKKACRQSAAWRRAGFSAKLSINLSPSNLREAGFLGEVASLLAETGVPADTLEFEFTEGMLTSTEAGVRAAIDEIRAHGATVAIDDFGTGYSNFDYLTRLPVDVLKLDRSFVQPLDGDPRRQKLVRSLINLSHDLDFRIVAEGVETATVYDMLKSWRCDEGQGYFMSRPLTPAAFAAFAAD